MPSPTDFIPIPELAPTGFLIFCRFADAPPSISDIFQTTQLWVLENVDTPLQLVLAYLDPEMMGVRVAPRHEAPIEVLRACGPRLSEEQRREIDAATHFIAVNTSDRLPGMRLGLWAAVAMAKACAERYGAQVALDADTTTAFYLVTPFPDLHSDFEPRLANFLRTVYSFHSKRVGDMTTSGMARFGLPDLQIVDIPMIDMEALGAAVIGLCQTLLTLTPSTYGDNEPPPSPVPAVLEIVVTGAHLRLARAPNAASVKTAAEARVRLEYGPHPDRPRDLFWTLTPPESYRGGYDAWLHSLVHTFLKPEGAVNTPVYGKRDDSARRRMPIETFTEETSPEKMLEISGRAAPNYVAQRADPAFRKRVEAAGRAAIQGKYEEFLSEFPGGRALIWGKPLVLAAAAAILWKRSLPVALIALGLAIWQAYDAVMTERRAAQIARNFKEVAERGEFAVAMPIMINKTMKAPGTRDAPGMFLLLPNDATDPISIYEAVAREARGTGGRDDPESLSARKRLSDQRFIPRRRTRIPRSWVQDKTIYVVD